MDNWLVGQGGTVNDQHEARLQNVSRRLACECEGRALVFQVLNSRQMSAFSWPSGHVFVTAGLMDRLDDAELAAAVSHELGHLLGDGHLKSPAGLKGLEKGLDTEARADELGVGLLQQVGLQPAAMRSMLQKVIDYGNLSPDAQVAMRRRISLLSGEAQALIPRIGH